jgi:predicted Rossmann-fold nucleotide-binding protein
MNEREKLNKLKDNELVAYWNVLQMVVASPVVVDPDEKTKRHLIIVEELLTQRNIPHEDRNLIVVADTLQAIDNQVRRAWQQFPNSKE